uniref:protein DGCR6L isoform X5 n=1 Tax=Halichoerus grypus TaxID=9711 RepID=UPI001658CC0D|nr:protein DGCR6L isoform X5 [Halichoerus grypus]
MERYTGAFEEAVDGARQQERHYQLLSALQSLVKELPSSFQQRLSYTTLSDLALALLDGTVFEIVQGLLEIQHLTEKSLYNQRLRLQNEHRVLRQALRQKHQEAQQACRPHNLPVLQAAQQRELEGAEPLSRPHHTGSGAPDPGGAAGNGPEDCPRAGPEGGRPAEHTGEGWGCWLLCDHQPTAALLHPRS